MKRRHFFQAASTTLATLGVSQLQLQYQSLRYAKVLAQPTRRKRALLVGVNQYPDSQRFLDLYGCATDAEMQRQLLIHRFGFHPSDIVVVSDDSDLKPTRDNILTTFEDHLIKPTKPGDVVVFHFSGHGSRVIDPEPADDDDLNSTFVPGDIDGDTNTVDDIMGRTLFLLMSALDTDNVTAVLDSCYAGGGTRGSLRIRAADGGKIFQPSDRELNYQDRWLSKLEATQGIDRTEFLKRREIGVAKGVVIAAAQRDQEAADVTFDGFDAGAFTYLMTQFLWQQTDSLSSTISRVRSDVRKLSGQIPLIDTQEISIAATDGSRELSAADAMYFVADDEQSTPAEAVVTSAESGEATIWLGGVHPDVISTFSRGSTLTAADNAEAALVIAERQGLFAKVTTADALSANTLLRETARVIPTDLTLTIGIDPSLAADANQIAERINGWPHMQAAVARSNGLYDTEVHLILSKMTAAYRQQLPQQSGLPPENTIGLFDQGLTQWIPDSFKAAETPLQSILNELFPNLRAHLAARFMRVSLNAGSSQLAIQTQVDNLDTQAVVTTAASGRASGSLLGDEYTSQVEVNQRLQISLTNQDTVALNVAIVGIEPSGQFKVLLPTNVSSMAVLSPGQTKLFPAPADQNDMFLEIPGFYSVMVLASRQPFTRTLKGLDAIANGTRLPEVTDPDEEISGLNGLLEGFDSSRGETEQGDGVSLATHDMATLLMTVEAISTT